MCSMIFDLEDVFAYINPTMCGKQLGSKAIWTLLEQGR
jgi:hypothetical protein